MTKPSRAPAIVPTSRSRPRRIEAAPVDISDMNPLIAAHQGVFIATPEYNNSVPPLLKNTIDWVSRVEATGDAKFRNRVYAIGSTSDGMIGGARALIDCRKIVQAGLGAILIPSKIEVSRAQDAFNESGEMTVEPVSKLLKRVCRQLVDLSARLAD